MGKKLAVVLFNLGGPDSPEAVEPFLFNLFNDRAIISAPGLIRWPLAKFISSRRAPIAQEIYREMGGRSPIVPQTEQQASALEKRLAGSEDWDEARVFIVMRYWHPRASDVAREVAAFGADQIVALPLYPQFSTTTSASSLKEWGEAAKRAGISAPTATVCCHPVTHKFIVSYAELIREKLEGLTNYRLLFSAHGLPKRVVDKGDPYQWQVEQTAAKVAEELNIEGLDWNVCYQSKVGPLEWIGPATDDEIKRAGTDGKAVVVVPIAFVSEHSETLVELDIEYRELAAEHGVPQYERVAAVGTASAYMDALAEMALNAAARSTGIAPEDAPVRLCPARWSGCPVQKAS